MGVDDAVEEVAADEAKVAVNRGQGALDEGPAVGLEVVDLGVGVVQVGDGNYSAVSYLSNGHGEATEQQKGDKTYPASGGPRNTARRTSGTPSSSQQRSRRGRACRRQ